MLVKQGTRVDYFYKEFYIDTKEEINLINKEECCPGSIVYVISTGAVYMLNNKKEWVEQ